MAKCPKNRTKRWLSPWAVCHKKRTNTAAASSESALYISAACFPLCIRFCVTRVVETKEKSHKKPEIPGVLPSKGENDSDISGISIRKARFPNGINQSVFGMSPCVRSRTTSPAMISPATDGTNATDPGTLQREEPPCAATASPCPSSPACIRGRRAFSSE